MRYLDTRERCICNVFKTESCRAEPDHCGCALLRCKGRACLPHPKPQTTLNPKP